MAKLKDGFYKLTAEAVGSNSYMLLAGGGSKALSDFATASGVVTALGTNGNYVTWTKNGTANNLMVPYAISSHSAKTLNTGELPSSTTNKAETAWCKFATLTFNDSAYSCVSGYLFFSGVEMPGFVGILHYHFRADKDKTQLGSANLKWLVNTSLSILVISVKTADNVYDLYVNNYSTWVTPRIHNMMTIGSFVWNIGSWTTTKPTVSHTSTLSGRVNYAISASNADTLDGIHASDLLTSLANINDSSHPESIYATIGGTTKYLKVNYSLLSRRLLSNPAKNVGGLSYCYTSGTSGTDNTGDWIGPTSSTTYMSVLRLQSHTTEGALYYRDLIFDVNSDKIWSRRVSNSKDPVVREIAMMRKVEFTPKPTDEGWYRFASFSTNSGRVSNCIFSILRAYYSPENEHYIFSVSIGYNGHISITLLSGYIGGHLISKIRVVYTNVATCYLDFYMTSTNNEKYENAYAVEIYSGDGTIQTPTLTTTAGGTTYEFTTVNGCKSDRGFTGSLIGNAASATKLSTSRKIWGLNFDGSADVNGNIKMGSSGAGLHYQAKSGDWSYFPFFLHNSADSAVLFRATFVGKDESLSYFSLGPTLGSFTITNKSLVGIGTTAPTQKLHVNGLVNIEANSGILTIGCLNASYTHYSTTGGTHWFNKAVEVNGSLTPHVNGSFDIGSTGKRWSTIYGVNGNFSGTIKMYTGDSALAIYSGRITDARSDGNICFLTSIDNTDPQSHAHPTQHGGRCNIVLQPRGGLVYIGTNPDGGDATYKLYVNGRAFSKALDIDSGSDAKIILNNTDAETKHQYISFRQDGTLYGYLGTFGDNTLKWSGNTILHSGNSSVSKSGQTLTVKINGVELSLTNTTYSSLKNPNAIKFKKTDGTTITYDGSSAADLTAGVNYASSSNTAAQLSNTSIDSGTNPSAAASGQYVKWYSQISHSSGYAGNNYGFPVSNNANGILWMGTHSGPYGGLLGISSNGRIYYRFITNNSFPTTANGGSWYKVAWTSDIPTKVSQLTNDSGYLTSANLSNYVTLDTALTITGVKTFSTQQNFIVAQGTSPFTVTSTTKVSNLNSDLLDGYDSSRFLRAKEWIAKPGLDADTLELNMMCFTYSNNAPYNGTIIYFSGAIGGTYGLLLNASYFNSGLLAFRSRNGDLGTWKDWSTILTLHNYTGYVNTTNFPGLNKTGTVTQVKIGSTAYNPSSGIVSLPAYPISLPANGGNADTVDNCHASDFVKIKPQGFALYKKGTWTKILTFTITKDSLTPSISFSWHPTECARGVWADFNINIRSGGILFMGNWKGSTIRTLKCVGDGTTYDVWVSGTKHEYDPFGAIQITSTFSINSYNAGSLAYQDAEPTGTYSANVANTTISNYANSAGSVAWANVTGKPSFATVATSGSYNDLSNKPTIPTVTNYYWANVKISSSSNEATTPTFSTIATTGVSYVSTLRPRTTETHYLGSANNRWNGVFSKSGNFSGLLTLSVATGTAPFKITSTTVNTNLNADMVDGKHASDFATSGHTHSYLPLSGGTMTGNIKVYTDGDGRGLKFGTSTLNSLGNQLLWQSAEAIRFGSSSWDWDAWAGLKYKHSSKIIYLGLADGTIFKANTALSGGKLYLPGISEVYTGNGTNKVWHAGNDGSGSGLDADTLDGYHIWVGTSGLLPGTKVNNTIYILI